MSCTSFHSSGMLAVFAAGLFASATCHAATLCVDNHGHSNCYATITAAVNAASAGDTINVASGTYGEEVHITKPLSLIGQNRENTIIAANGHSNGIYVDGLSAPGLANLTITGFTVQDAQFEGMLIQNASDVTIFDNIVRHNNQAFQLQTETCAGLPAFETNENTDCGEGLHLMGVDHSTIADNLVEGNAGGILLTDETASNHDNIVTRNTVENNPYDCGITIASHRPYPGGPGVVSFGIHHNTVSQNLSRHNGYGSDQGGAGIGIFAPGPGTSNTMNSVVHNRVIDNSMPGISLHTHAFLTFPNHPPNPNINDNVIADNYVSGNGVDGSLGISQHIGISVLGTTPVTGIVISGNTVQDEDIDIAVKSASEVDAHLNSLEGKHVGVAELNAGGLVDATENWWGCHNGPTANGCSTVTGNVRYTPWLTHPLNLDTPRGD